MSTPHLPSQAAAEADATRYAALLAEARAIQGVSLGRDAWRRLRKKRVAMLSLWFLVGLGVLAFFTPLLPLAPPRAVDLNRTYEPPHISPLFVEAFPQFEDDDQQQAALRAGFGQLSWPFSTMLSLRGKIFGGWQLNSVCGCDTLGRDLLARLFWGARISLIVGLVATLVSLVIGVSYGAISGYIGGWVDNLLMRLVDVLYSVPFIFVVIFLVSILSHADVKKQLDFYHINRIMIFFVVVGAIYWLTMARVIRGQVMSLKQEQFVEAARTIGASRGRIIFRHLVPNLWSVIIVYLTLTIPNVMLFEAFLSFLGLGVEPPDVSWGVLANEGVQVLTPVVSCWWLVVFPGVALGATLFCLNFLGDGLRDALDPRLKNR